MSGLICSSDGSTLEIVVLAMIRDRLRVASPGFSDALELSQRGDHWVTDTGRELELEFLSIGANECAQGPAPNQADLLRSHPGRGSGGRPRARTLRRRVALWGLFHPFHIAKVDCVAGAPSPPSLPR